MLATVRDVNTQRQCPRPSREASAPLLSRTRANPTAPAPGAASPRRPGAPAARSATRWPQRRCSGG
eukprot:1631363-Pyramimonas_sp.AAC.1